VIEDDIYRQYRIPTGSVIIANSWAMLHDEVKCPKIIETCQLERFIQITYPDPHTFKPERFLLNGKLNPAVRDPLDIVFGFGRRSVHCTICMIQILKTQHSACPGKFMGWDSVWIMITSMLAVFDISKPIGPDGKTIEPPLGHISELVVCVYELKNSILLNLFQCSCAVQMFHKAEVERSSGNYSSYSSMSLFNSIILPQRVTEIRLSDNLL
jgi:hypothetical protein